MNSESRSRVVPPLPPRKPDEHDDDGAGTGHDKTPTHRCVYRTWRELLRRTFRIDVERCGARMRLRALVLTSAGIERHLKWLGEPTEPSALAPSRGPRFSKSPVIRRRLGETVRAELFDAHRARCRPGLTCARGPVDLNQASAAAAIAFSAPRAGPQGPSACATSRRVAGRRATRRRSSYLRAHFERDAAELEIAKKDHTWFVAALRDFAEVGVNMSPENQGRFIRALIDKVVDDEATAKA
ncbi:MAG: hypothetical protein OZ928_10980 [Polyangiaceae bacterium]|nr:hypothetical protein [Polyangiaceae bacterium]